MYRYFKRGCKCNTTVELPPPGTGDEGKYTAGKDSI
jgi:hypothetical protein